MPSSVEEGKPQCTSSGMSQLVLHTLRSPCPKQTEGFGKLLHFLMRGDAKSQCKGGCKKMGWIWSHSKTSHKFYIYIYIYIKEHSNLLFSIAFLLYVLPKQALKIIITVLFPEPLVHSAQTPHDQLKLLPDAQSSTHNSITLS